MIRIHRLKYFLCALLTIIMTLSCVPFEAFALTTTTYKEGIRRKYTINVPVSKFTVTDSAGMTSVVDRLYSDAWNNSGQIYFYLDRNLTNRVSDISMKVRKYSFVTDLEMKVMYNNTSGSSHRDAFYDYHLYYNGETQSNPSSIIDNVSTTSYRGNGSSDPAYINVSQATFTGEFHNLPYTESIYNIDYIGKDISTIGNNMLTNANSYSVKVYDELEDNQLKSITISPNTMTCEVGDSVTFDAAISPSSLAASWSVSNTNIGQITSSSVNGGKGSCIVKAAATGQTSVYLRSADGAASGVATLIVKPKTISPTGISLNKTTSELVPGGAQQLTATVSPGSATDKTVTWKSSNNAVAVVNSSGLVAAKSNGTADITAETSNGLNAVCVVTVSTPVTGVTLNPDSLTLPKGGQYMLNAAVSPNTATNRNIIFSSNNSAVATVNNAGQISAIKSGTAVITARTSDGGKTHSCTVTVTNELTSLIMNASQKDLTVGEGYQLKVSAIPADHSSGAIVWSSSNDDAVSVSASGYVTAKAIGNAQITASNGAIQTICDVTVTQPVTGVNINKSAVGLTTGGTETLIATVLPYDAGNKDLIWSTSNPAAAVVTQSGKITATGNGIAEIKATSPEGGYAASCVVTVSTPVKVVSIDPKELRLPVNTSYSMYASVFPYTAEDKNLTWESSSPDIVKVNSSGSIMTYSPGSAVITAKSKANPDIYDECIVTVTNELQSIKLNKNSLALSDGEAETLMATAAPANHTSGELKWSSSDEDVVTVTQSGKVEAVKPGRAVITVSNSGIQDTCMVTVLSHVEGINIDPEELRISVNTSYSLNAYALPDNAEDSDIIWKSSSPDIVKVNSSGNIIAYRPGTAAIIAKSKANPSIYAECVVTVTNDLRSIKLNKNSLTLGQGGAETLAAVAAPSDHTSGELIWSSSDEEVATVTQSGKVEGIKPGNAVITVSNNGIQDTCSVNVVRTVQKIAVKPESVTLIYDDPDKSTAVIKATIQPATASEKSIVAWTDDSGIIELDGDSGSVSLKAAITAMKLGKSKVTFASGDGIFTVEVPVDVIQPVRGFELDESSYIMTIGDSMIIPSTFTPTAPEPTNKNIIWTSDNPSIVTVSTTSGEITAIAEGTAVIEAKTEDGGFTDTAVITSKLPAVPPSAIKITNAPEKIKTGESEQLGISFSPDNAEKIPVLWSSNNMDVAAVDQNGTVTGISEGKAVITVSAEPEASELLGDSVEISIIAKTGEGDEEDGEGEIFDGIDSWEKDENGIPTKVMQVEETLEIDLSPDGTEVMSENPEVADWTKVDVMEEKAKTTTGRQPSASASFDPENVIYNDDRDRNMLYSSSGNVVEKNIEATNSIDGFITAISEGQTFINFVSPAGKAQKVKIIVIPKGLELSLKVVDITLKPGRTYQLEPIFMPEFSTSSIKYTSINEDIATVSDTGLITAVSKGSTVVVVTDMVSGLSAKSNVLVKQSSDKDDNNGSGGSGGSGGGNSSDTEGKNDNPATEDNDNNKEGDVTVEIETDEGTETITIKRKNLTPEQIAALLARAKELKMSQENVMRAEIASILNEIYDFSSDKSQMRSYTDVLDETPYAEAIRKVVYFIGYPDKSFRPFNDMTRAEFATVCSRLPVVNMSDSARAIRYIDVDENEWFYEAVYGATQNGYFVGDPGGAFRPNDYITEYQLGVMIERILNS